MNVINLNPLFNMSV